MVAAVAVTILLASLLWPTATPQQQRPDPRSTSAQQQDSNTSFASSSNPSSDEVSASAQQRRQARLATMQELLTAAQAQPGNLQATLSALRQQCLPDEYCAALIDQALADFPDADFARLVANAIARLPLYESAMQTTTMSMTTPPRQRYATIHALREQTLGVEETAALFGQEAAWAEYQFSFAELSGSAALATMSTEQRLAALDALRQDTQGDYQQALSAVEGARGRYERELTLLSAGITDPAAIAEIRQQLRLSHFGAEQAAVMERRDQEVAQQQQNVVDYQEALQQLNTELAPLKEGLQESEWQQLYQQRLTELRLQHFP
jgi:hypothetical protein